MTEGMGIHSRKNLLEKEEKKEDANEREERFVFSESIDFCFDENGLNRTTLSLDVVSRI